MYYSIRPFIVDEKKHIYIAGSLYNDNNELVEGFIFDDGVAGNIESASFKLIVNEEDSYTKGRLHTDMIILRTGSAGMLNLVSPKAQELLKSTSEKDFELHDIQIKGIDLEINDYKILKITSKIECIDQEKSELRFSRDGSIRRIRTLVLETEKIPTEKNLFLLKERMTAVVIIHDRLASKIKEAELTGFFIQDLLRYKHNFL